MRKNKEIITIVSLLLLFLIIEVCAAEQLTLEEVIELGLQSNNELRNYQEAISILERELALIKAKENWQVKLETDYTKTYEDGELISNNTLGGNKIDLGISKNFSSGLSINLKIAIEEGELQTDMFISISQQILPAVPTSLSKQNYEVTKNLIKARENYRQQKVDKVLTWFDSYLNLCRMIEKREIYEQDLNNAQKNKKEVMASQEIGEAGKQQVLTAELSVKEAEYRLKEINTQIDQAEFTLYQEIGLTDMQNISIKADSPFINEINKNAEEIVNKYINMANLLEVAEQNSYELLANKIDQEILAEQLEWLEKEDSINLNLTASYDTAQEQFNAGLNLYYQFYDGGQHNITCADKEAEIDSKTADYNDLYNNLKLKLKQSIDDINLNILQLEKEKIKLTRGEYEADTARQQYVIGLIDYLEYQETWLESKEAELNINTIKDQLLISWLKLIKLVNIDELTGRILK